MTLTTSPSTRPSSSRRTTSYDVILDWRCSGRSQAHSCRLKVELRRARGLASAEIPDWRTPSSPSSLPAGLVGPQR